MNTWLAKFAGSALIMVAAVYLLLRIAPPLPISSLVTQKTALFTVSGQGKVTVVPDVAFVSLGISVNLPTVKAAQSQANTITNKIAADLKAMGINATDIKTENYSIYPEYDYSRGSGRITGYRVTADLRIKVSDLEKINQVIDTATADGANTVGGIQLTVDEDRQKELLKEARSQAISEAKAKATELAAAAGISLGRVVNIEESSPASPVPYLMAADKVGRGGAGESTQIEPGSTDIVTYINLSYETR